MRNLFHVVLLTLCIASLRTPAAEDEFRLDQNRIWLSVQDKSLPQFLAYFAAAGVDVQIDPDTEKNITGTCRDADVETVLDELLTPYNYLLDWRRETGSLGIFTRLTGIRVFRKDHAGSVQPLRPARRIETSFDGKSRFIAREILVGFRPGSSIENLRTFLARTGGTIIAANADLGVYRILLPEGANVPDLVSQLGNESSIAHAEPNYVYDTPKIAKTMSVMDLGKVNWNASDPGSVAVSVLDTGLAPDDSLNRAVISAFDATHPKTPLTADAVGHGTLMAQLASGLLDPYGRAVGEGIPIVAVKAFADDGYADTFTLMSAMTYAVQHSTGPVSLSWGSETPSGFIQSAVQYAMDKGRPVFAAVGNENSGRPIYPAAYPGVIGIAASDGNQYADYSNRGDFVDIVAPGSAGGAKGTSVATAYVSHVAALYMQHHPGASAADTVAALQKAAGPTRFLTEPAVKQLLAK